MIRTNDFIENFADLYSDENLQPWEIIDTLENILENKFRGLTDDYIISNDVAIHKTAIVEQNVIFKGKIIIVNLAPVTLHHHQSILSAGYFTI